MTQPHIRDPDVRRESISSTVNEVQKAKEVDRRRSQGPQDTPDLVNICALRIHRHTDADIFTFHQSPSLPRLISETSSFVVLALGAAMECWAHAAAIRRQAGNHRTSASDSSISSSSTAYSTASSNFLSIPRDCEPQMTDAIDEAHESPRTDCPRGKSPHVGIIGAGMSGLRCAEVLSRQGVKVTILEGRDRIGGRVCE